MKKVNSKLFIFLFLTSLVSCNSQENSKQETKANDTNLTVTEHNDMIETTLKSQLLKTYGASNEVTDIKYFEYDRNDLDASVIILDELLKKSGYVADKANFEKKVNQIFGETVKVDNLLYINYFNGKCNTPKEVKYFDSDGFKTNYYFSLDKQLFIGQYAIPELIDYKTKYPEIAKIEETIETEKSRGAGEDEKIFITRWKDVHDLEQEQKFNVQLLVNRNLYLFNDDQSKLPWLQKNDEGFLKTLVLTFGWTEDEKLLKWVIENNKFDPKNPMEFGKMFYTKKCDGTLKLQPNVYKFLQKTVTPKNQGILDDIKSFVQYFANFENKVEDLNDKQRLEVLSNIVYFAEQYKYEKGFDNRRIMSWMYLTNGDGKNAETLKQNNYFNLPKFKQWWEAQYTDGDFDYVAEVDGGERVDY